MAHLGDQEYYELMDVTAVDADEPVTAYRAKTLRSNIAHLVSVQPQYRLHWVEATDETTVFEHPMVQTNLSNSPTLFSWRFPLTVLTSSRPASIDYRIAIITTGSITSMTVNSRIVWDTYPPQPSATIAHDSLLNHTVSATPTTATWYGAIQNITSDLGHLFARRSYIVSDEGTFATVQLPMARLDVHMDSVYSGTGTARIVGLMVRELV